MKFISRFFMYALLLVLILNSACSDDDEPKANQGNRQSQAHFNENLIYGSVIDIDKNTYQTIIIGGKTWMAENLRTTHYSDGSEIPQVMDKDTWSTVTSGASCVVDNTTDEDIIRTYGRLYNWHAVNTGKLAPKGWHVATDEEWSVLTDHLGGGLSADKLKEAGIVHWKDPNDNATNASGFTALPAGFRDNNGVFKFVGDAGYWWTSSFNIGNSSWQRSMYYNSSNTTRDSYFKEMGYSVRCIKD